MNPRIGWLLAAVFAFAAWRAYDWAGLAFAASAIVFWLLLQFNRAVRVMKNAAASPVGHVASAVMFHAGLARGMTMLQIVTKTKSLGRRRRSSASRRERRPALRAWQAGAPETEVGTDPAA